MSLGQASRLLYRALVDPKQSRALKSFYLERAVTCFVKSGRGDLAARVRQAERLNDDGLIKELLRELGETLV